MGWSLLMILIGLFMLVGGSTRTDFLPYRLLSARSRQLWGDRAHRFHQISGALVMIVGFLYLIGVF